MMEEYLAEVREWSQAMQRECPYCQKSGLCFRHSHVPNLLDEIERLREENAKLNEYLQEALAELSLKETIP